MWEFLSLWQFHWYKQNCNYALFKQPWHHEQIFLPSDEVLVAQKKVLKVRRCVLEVPFIAYTLLPRVVSWLLFCIYCYVPQTVLFVSIKKLLQVTAQTFKASPMCISHSMKSSKSALSDHHFQRSGLTFTSKSLNDRELKVSFKLS